VASGILPDVEGGILPPGKASATSTTCGISNMFGFEQARAGLDTRLDGRQGRLPLVAAKLAPLRILHYGSAVNQTDDDQMFTH
jgi:hypothetical protein